MSMDQNLSQPIKHESEEKMLNVIDVSPYFENDRARKAEETPCLHNDSVESPMH